MTIDGHKFASTSTMPRGIARADYPMVPLFKDKVFYFEVKITTESQDGYGFPTTFSGPFCAAKTQLTLPDENEY